MRCWFDNASGPDGLPYVDYVVGPGGDTGPVVDPAAVAAYLFRQMAIRPVPVGMAPRTVSDDADSLGLVGLPVWMWVDEVDAQSFGPASLSLSTGGVTVTLEAGVERVEWDMGDGTTVTCTTPGTPWTEERGATASPDCGHTYTTTSAGLPGEAFPVTATSYWVANWSASTGPSGVLTQQLQATEQVHVGESQVVVTSD
ncbi:hypothetical protein [Aquipuribacter nitratireducens]|uniref:ATP/GTP-binding protein n=1 Tax=Aquipuribacter nitratireducens TaxID=650104 RepID=A0ABW0GJV6_9MICO